jgi:hypothetical protein
MTFPSHDHHCFLNACGWTRQAAHHRLSHLFSQKTKQTFLTMISRRKLSKLPPRSMMEVTNVLKGMSGRATTMISCCESSKLPPQSMMEVTDVLKGISGRATLASVAKLEHTLAQKDS